MSENSIFVFFLQEVEVNLVITDYCMPEMTGYDLLKKIKVCVCVCVFPSLFLILEAFSYLR